MECLFSPNIFDEKNSIDVTGDELKHIKALRLNQGDKILITNGKGVTCLSELFQVNKEKAEFLILERYEWMNENDFKLSIAIGLLNARDRYEFAVEKAVELGVNTIIPLYSKFTQKMKFKSSRIEAKILAALKQCKRSILPELMQLTKINALKKDFNKYDNVIILDESGTVPAGDILGDNILVLVGPEGGFDNEEVEQLAESENVTKWNLGIRRLRTETAVVSALSIINYLKQKDN